MLSGVTKSLIVFGTTVLSVSLLTACAYLSSEPPPTSYSYPVSTAIIPESDLESLLASDDTTETSEETSETSFTVETEPHENPFGDFAYDEGYIAVAADVLYNSWGKGNMWCGFDNPYSIYLLQEEVYDKTGVLDTSLTLSDVNYFQGISALKEYCYGSFSEQATSYYDENNIIDRNRIELIRAVLSYLGLRFGIDEIPASYLQERFPRYFYDYFMYDGDIHAYLVGDLEFPEEGIIELNDIENPDFIDFLIFYSCTIYNEWRSYIVYDNPYGTGSMIQVRDAATGKNVLIPTDGQAEAMQEDINTIPGLENISIYIAETPEEFYEYYGCYPADLLENVGYLDTQEGFEEYYNSLPESEQNELYAPILFE